MKNTVETKNEMVLRELYIVKEFTTGRVYKPGNTNVHNMASDCIDVIEDLQKEIQILREEVNVRNAFIEGTKRARQDYRDGYIPALKVEDIQVDEEKLNLYMAHLGEPVLNPDGSVFVPFNEQPEFMEQIQMIQERDRLLGRDPVSVFAAEMRKNREEAEEHNALLEKMRAELRGDICE